MKRAGNLFETVTSFTNLYEAAFKAAKGKKDRGEVALFLMDIEKEILSLRKDLVNGCYAPGPLRTFEIKDPKRREISAAPFRDRVVHHALCSIVEPFFERRYIYHSYACRKEKGTHKAIKQAQSCCRRYRNYLKLDVRSFFASIDHDVVMDILERIFKDKRLLSLFQVIIDHGSDTRNGLPIGNLTSQHLANLYLDQLDHFVKEELGIKGYLRYMDDFILFSNSKKELHEWYGKIDHFLASELRLVLKSRATTLSPVSEGLNFLGFRIYPNLIRLQNRTKYRRWKNIRRIEREFLNGFISEEEYQMSMQSIVEHLKIGDTYHLRRDMFRYAPG